MLGVQPSGPLRWVVQSILIAVSSRNLCGPERDPLFSEPVPVLTARRVIDRDDWTKAFQDWQGAAAKNLKDHRREDQSSARIIDDLCEIRN